ncbi:MAG TPA: transglutaminaseTgpA domain-containing protein [Micromonosporaceae bacterium]|jgi:hypothetical protein
MVSTRDDPAPIWLRWRRSGWARRLAIAATMAGLVCLAGVSLNRVYSGVLLAELVLGAAIASALIPALLRPAPAWLVAPVSVIALVGYGLWAVEVSAHAGGVAGDLSTLTVDAARNAVPRLLSALIPIEPQPDTVLAPVVLAWLAGFAGTELAVRSARPAAALVAPTLLYVSALVLVGPNAGVALWQPLLFAALAALCLATGSAASGAAGVRGIGRRELVSLRVRTASGFAVGLAAVLAVVVAVSPLVAGAVSGAPGDPRRYVQPPDLDVTDQNPLIRLSGWAAFPEQNLFRVEILGDAQPAPPATPAPTDTASLDPFAAETFAAETEAPPEQPSDEGDYDTRLRLAVLPDWDGVTWHLEADYRNAGRVLPPVAAPPGVDPEQPAAYPPLTIEERITVDQLRGRLLPAVASPTRVDGIRVAYDQREGGLLDNAALDPGTTYTVTSVNEGVDVNQLMASDVPHGDAVARYLAVGPSVPDELSRFAQKVAEGENSPYLRALALQEFLQEHYTFATDAPSGHAYPNLSFFLLAQPRAGGQRGTSEQFATAFATLGRLLGLPTRVVVGFHVPAGGGMVTAGDALAWPEVLFSGAGWVPFDPMPPPQSQAQPVEPEFVPPPPPSSDPPVSVTPSAESAPVDSLGPEQALAAAQGPGTAAIVAGSGVGALGLALMALMAIMLVRALRSRARLRSADPARRVVGAWDEVLDGLLLAGRPPPQHLTAVEVADYAAHVVAQTPGRHARRPRPASPDLVGLARTVNAVAFGGRTVADPDESVAQAAHTRAVAFRRALYRRRSWWRRLLWWVDPRPLRRR